MSPIDSTTLSGRSACNWRTGRVGDGRQGRHTAATDERLLPGAADMSQRRGAAQADEREDDEPAAEAAGESLERSEQVRQHETTDAPGRPDDARHHADLTVEPLRHELKHRPV